jgi:hypothetical protein
VPGYYRAVPPGQKPFRPSRRLTIILALMRVYPGKRSFIASGLEGAPESRGVMSSRNSPVAGRGGCLTGRGWMNYPRDKTKNPGQSLLKNLIFQLLVSKPAIKVMNTEKYTTQRSAGSNRPKAARKTATDTKGPLLKSLPLASMARHDARAKVILEHRSNLVMMSRPTNRRSIANLPGDRIPSRGVYQEVSEC